MIQDLLQIARADENPGDKFGAYLLIGFLVVCGGPIYALAMLVNLPFVGVGWLVGRILK